MKNKHEKTNFNQLVMKIIFYVNSNIKKKSRNKLYKI